MGILSVPEQNAVKTRCPHFRGSQYQGFTVKTCILSVESLDNECMYSYSAQLEWLYSLTFQNLYIMVVHWQAITLVPLFYRRLSEHVWWTTFTVYLFLPIWFPLFVGLITCIVTINNYHVYEGCIQFKLQCPRSCSAWGWSDLNRIYPKYVWYNWKSDKHKPCIILLIQSTASQLAHSTVLRWLFTVHYCMRSFKTFWVTFNFITSCILG